MRTLGIDPGLATMGYGVVERAGNRLRPLALGVIRTSGSWPTERRLAQIRKDLLDVVGSYEPEVVAVEQLFFNLNVRSAIAVGQASGVALATVGERGLDVYSYTPPEVKLSVTGTGAASKRQVQEMVARTLGLEKIPQFPDAADACALAICHLNGSGLRDALEASG